MEWTDWKNITAEQIGAEPGRTIATQEEAEEGTATAVRSWTAQLIRQAISAVTTAINNALTSHVNNRNNPHGVTAAQAGASASNHTHTAAQVGAAATNHTHPATAPAAHNHDAANINAGTLPVARGGTGVTSFAPTNVIITFVNGFSGLVCNRTFDNFVIIRGNLLRNAAITSQVNVLIMPSGHRPPNEVRRTFTALSSLNMNISVSILGNGEIRVQATGSGSSSIAANTAFPVFIMFRIS